ncbi:hypothetical protein Q3G72_007925 [Acer saccharum]|nr:hypothetical protein Q3G72_007925 [Acer saccharum]
MKGLASSSKKQQQEVQVMVCQQCGQNGHWADMCPGQGLAPQEEEAQAFYQYNQNFQRNGQGYGGNNYNPNWRNN